MADPTDHLFVQEAGGQFCTVCKRPRGRHTWREPAVAEAPAVKTKAKASEPETAGAIVTAE